MVVKNDCCFIGTIIKTHGISGELILKPDIDFPRSSQSEDYNNMESVFIEIDEQLVPFFISQMKIRMHHKMQSAIVKFDDIDTIPQAKELLGNDLYAPVESLPQQKENNFLYSQLIGFTVFDKQFGEIGKVDEILEFPDNPVFKIMKNNKEILIPVNDEFIKKVAQEKKIIEIEAPKGLIEVYLNP